MIYIPCHFRISAMIVSCAAGCRTNQIQEKTMDTNDILYHFSECGSPVQIV